MKACDGLPELLHKVNILLLHLEIYQITILIILWNKTNCWELAALQTILFRSWIQIKSRI